MIAIYFDLKKKERKKERDDEKDSKKERMNAK